MNFAAIYAALITWAQTLTSPDGQTENEGIPFVRAGEAWPQADVIGEISITTERTRGIDFESHEYRSAENDVLLTSEGPREIVVEIKITSIFQEADATAQQALSRLRARAFRASARAILSPVGVAVAEVGPLVPLALTDENGHTLSVATVDVTCNAYASDSDGAESGSYIDTVIASDNLGWTDEVIE